MSKFSNCIALVVEDDLSSRQYLKFMLKRLDIAFVEAENGEEALEIMKDAKVGIMLLDIALGPGMSGIQLCERLKQEARFSNTPAVAVTAFAQDNLADFERVGFSGYLSKPYLFEQLSEILDQYLPT